ncbi:MAG: protein-L-isoaspartate(D-aspartate) O-methyltransferase [Deltaproteobacteria bacterium]|nr:MAG: protein-L-isoaspartate(D-aspartate) O-methyltransferase [Deltaproteobacteria bacterium]
MTAPPPSSPDETKPSPASEGGIAADIAARQDERDRMVAEQIEARGVTDPRVLAAMAKVPRHLFVPDAYQAEAYQDHPLPIGHGVTISQPYIVALMTELAEVRPGDKVLEIGTGSGYQAAVLAELGAEVYSIEVIEPLARRAKERLAKLGYDRVHVRHGDGYRGWPEAAPFDAVVVTAAPPEVPEALREQLADGGRLVIPVGSRYQELKVITRRGNRFDERTVIPVRFVPMVHGTDSGP